MGINANQERLGAIVPALEILLKFDALNELRTSIGDIYIDV